MRIATYNVNGVAGRLPVLLRWLEETRPNIVCLQELRAPDEKFPIEAVRKAGYAAIWHGQKSWNGVVARDALCRRLVVVAEHVEGQHHRAGAVVARHAATHRDRG